MTLDFAHAPLWLTWTVYALAVARLTRVVVDDSITQPFRSWLRSVGFAQMARTVGLDASEVEYRVEARPGWRGSLARWLYELATCYWCVSVWWSAIVVALAHFDGSWFFYVALVACFSELAAIIGERTR